MYYIVIRICSDFQCKMHPLNMHDELNGFYNVERNIFICSNWSCVYCLVNMFMYFTQCNI